MGRQSSGSSEWPGQRSWTTTSALSLLPCSCSFLVESTGLRLCTSEDCKGWQWVFRGLKLENDQGASRGIWTASELAGKDKPHRSSLYPHQNDNQGPGSDEVVRLLVQEERTEVANRCPCPALKCVCVFKSGTTQYVEDI